MTAINISNLKTRVMTVLIIVALFSFPLGNAFADEIDPPAYQPLSGAGTTIDPYRITNCEQLAHVNVEPSASYRLTREITCYGQNYNYDIGSWENVDKQIVINDFTGTFFDGNGYRIQTRITDTENENVGLFRHLGPDSEIRNLNLETLRISTENTTSTNPTVVGALVAINDGSIRNVRVSNGNDGIRAAGTVGGIVGINNGTIQRAFAGSDFHPQVGTVKIYGGVAGINTGTITDVISNGYSSWGATPRAGSICGGIVGVQTAGSINTSMSSGDTIPCLLGDKTGGIVGEISGETSINNSYARLDQGYSFPAKLTGAIVGSNPENIDLSTTYFDGEMLSEETCDNTGFDTCNKVSDYKEFYTPDSPIYTNWDIEPNSQYVAGYGWASSNSAWAYDSSSWENVRNGTYSNPGRNYLPSIDIQRGNVLRGPAIKHINASSTQASFSWLTGERDSYGNEYSATYGNATEWDIYVGIVPEGEPGEEVSVEYSHLASVPGSTDERTPVSYTATNLDPSVFYDFIIQGKNGSGEGDFSSSIEVKPVPTQLSAPEEVEVQSGTATVQWQDAPLMADNYTVEYKKSTDTTWNHHVTSNPNARISPLEQSTSYDFRVRANNIRGTGPASDVLTVTTTTQNAYTISTCQDLQAVNDDLYGHYTLTQDIDCSGSSAFNNGDGFYPLGINFDLDEPPSDGFGLDLLSGFAGTFEGNNHTISNLEVNLQGFVGGLFAFIDGGVIRNFNLNNGHVIGSSAGDHTVYTDTGLTMVAGGLSALAANATIENVSTNIDIQSDNTNGHVALSGGLIGAVLPSNFGAFSSETNLTITNSHASGDTSGFVSAGLVGGTLPLDALNLIFGIMGGGFEDMTGPNDLSGYLGSRTNVSISDSSTTGNLSCSMICAGVIGLNTANLTLTNVLREGTTGSFETEISGLGGSFLSILEMVGPISTGAIGVNFPISFNANPSTLNVTNLTVNGQVNGTITAGLIGISAPSLHVNWIELVNSFNQLGIITLNSFAEGFEMGKAILDNASLVKSFSVNGATINATNTCTLACTGVSLANLGFGEYNNVTVAGDLTTQEVNPETAGETLAMISAFGPLTSGFVGINLPISTSDAGGTGLSITNSRVLSDLQGTAATGLTLANLPGISLDIEKFKDAFAPFGLTIFDDQLDDLRAQYYSQYGDYWQDDPDVYPLYQEQATQMMGDSISGLAGYASEVLTGTPSLIVTNTSVEGDISCSVLCAGVSGISLSRILVNGFSLLGDMTNDNADFLSEGNPLSMCPIQITAGVVGLQAIAPLTVENSSIQGNITVNQTGTIPDTSIAGLIDSFLSPEEDEDPFSSSNLIQLGCALGSSLFQGTGGVTGTFISPFDLSNMLDDVRGVEGGTTPEWVTTISNTTHSGDITSNSPQATGGLIGLSFGESRISNSSNSGTITNSTFAEMFRTPLASASTGGLVGHSIGGFALEGDPVEAALQVVRLMEGDINIETILDDITSIVDTITLRTTNLIIDGSSSTGDIVSSNTAGGLVGTITTGGRITRSFATGDVHGVTAGGLVGSGFNAASPLGLLGFFSSLEMTDVYSRGDIIASDADNTFTFAGGLVGFMTHLGEFRITNAYSTGDISVRNNATDTRLVAGGFIGAELDLSIITKLAEVAISAAGDKTTGDENIDQTLAMVSYFGEGGLNVLSTLGMPLRSGFKIENAFTTSNVPANTAANNDMLIQEIATGLPESGVTSGAHFGFAFTVPEQEWQDLVNSVFDTVMAASSSDLEGDNPLETGLAGDLIEVLGELNWASPTQLAPNSYYDAASTSVDRCANSLPDVPNLITYELPKLLDLFSGQSNGLDIYGLIPPVKTLGGTPCGAVNVGAPNDMFFKNNTTAGPLNTWNFNGVWYAHEDDFPTFVADTIVDDGTGGGGGTVTPPPGGGTENPTTGGPSSFTPKKVTISDVTKTIEKIKGIAETKPLTKVLPNILKNTEKALKDDVDKVADKDKDKGIGSTITGIFSATGAFLIRNLLTVLLLITTGTLLWLYARKKKEDDDKDGSSDNPNHDFLTGLRQ